MRRGPLGAIIFGLALLMQLLAPALASQGHVVGPSGHLALCVEASSSDDADGSRSGSAPPHHEHCGLCQVVCGVAGLLEVRFDSVTFSLPTETRAAWALEPERGAQYGSDQHRFPRGPPILA